MSKTENLSVDLIQLKLGTQMRAKVDDDTVSDYADLWRAKHEFPPLDVFHDGERYILADGFHRLYGAKAAKRASVPCVIHKGTVREAILFACGANHEHGLHRSNADKQCAVDALLDDPEWCKRSARWIAEQCRVNDKTVAKRIADRKPSVLAESTADFRSSVESKDGKTRPVSNGKPRNGEAKTYNDPFDPSELTSESKDAFGADAPGDLRSVFELRDGFKEQRNKLTSIKTWLTQNENHPGAAIVVGAVKQRLIADIDNADSELKFSTPHCVCVYCHNKPPKVANCTACKGLGWITEQIYKAAPKGMQREKATA